MSTRLSLVGTTVGLSVLVIGIIGCMGTGQERTEATTKATAVVPVDVTKAKQELDLVVMSLTSLRDASDTADLRKLYNDLKTNRGLWQTAYQEVLTSSDHAITAGDDQMKRWHAQADTFTDADLRNASNKRESDLRTAVDALSKARLALVTESQSFNGKLDQIIQALDLDLSQTGAKAIKPVIGKLVDEDGAERRVLTDVSTTSQAVNAQTTP